MTFDKERHDYVEQSAEVVEALAVHRKRHKDIQEADRDVILEARKVAALLAAFDATWEKQFELSEDVSGSDDATLKRFTNEDAEIDVIGELVKDAVDYLPDPEDQPQPGSFAAVVTKLQRLFPSENYTGIVK